MYIFIDIMLADDNTPRINWMMNNHEDNGEDKYGDSNELIMANSQYIDKNTSIYQ